MASSEGYISPASSASPPRERYGDDDDDEFLLTESDNDDLMPDELMSNPPALLSPGRCKLLVLGSSMETSILCKKLLDLHFGPAGPFHMVLVVGRVHDLPSLLLQELPCHVYLMAYEEYETEMENGMTNTENQKTVLSSCVTLLGTARAVQTFSIPLRPSISDAHSEHHLKVIVVPSSKIAGLNEEPFENTIEDVSSPDLMLSFAAPDGVQDVVDDPDDELMVYSRFVTEAVQRYAPRYLFSPTPQDNVPPMQSHAFSYRGLEHTGKWHSLATIGGSMKYVHALQLQPLHTQTIEQMQQERPGFSLPNPFERVVRSVSKGDLSTSRLPREPVLLRHYKCEPIKSSSTGNTNVVFNEYDLVPEKGGYKARRRRQSIRLRIIHQAVLSFLAKVFFPLNYPRSVRQGYAHYQFFDSLQGLCSYLRGVLCTARVLQAAGVGNAETNAWAAALTWVLKDGIALLGGLVVSYKLAPHLDSHVKEFRFLADVLNNLGMTCDMLAPYLPSLYLVWWTALATLCKLSCGICAGATKASITYHFALEGNMADLNAKESTQETLVNLFGMALGLWWARKWSDGDNGVSDQHQQWALFGLLTLVHTWANYQAVVHLRLRTLNLERLRQVVEPTLLPLMVQEDCMDDRYSEQAMLRNELLLENLIDNCLPQLPSPEQVCESLWISLGRGMVFSDIDWNASLVRVLMNDANVLLNAFASERYMINISISGLLLKQPKIRVCLLTGATVETQLQAAFHALLLQAYWREHRSRVPKGPKFDHLVLIKKTLQQVRLLTTIAGSNSNNGRSSESLLKALRLREWETERLYLPFGSQRWTIVHNQSSALKKDS